MCRLLFAALALIFSTAAGAYAQSKAYASLESLAQASQTPAQQTPASGNGRVTVTLALEGIRIPNVNVALRSVDGNVVVAQTTSDGVGELTFPDIPPGRYIVRSTHDGFADTDSS